MTLLTGASEKFKLGPVKENWKCCADISNFVKMEPTAITNKGIQLDSQVKSTRETSSARNRDVDMSTPVQHQEKFNEARGQRSNK